MTGTIKICGNCQRNFDCGMAATAGCWCGKLPSVLPLEVSSSCLCYDCLKLKIQQEIESFVAAFKAGSIDNIAPNYQYLDADEMVQDIDYYLEGETWVFTAWFHLKRGSCCGNNCRHCPYGVTL